MKKVLGFLAVVILVSANAQAQELSCRQMALEAAKANYGNYPMKTQTRQESPNSYRVTVGIGNVEDGAHTYSVTFEGSSCDLQTATVCDLTQPGRGDSQACQPK